MKKRIQACKGPSCEPFRKGSQLGPLDCKGDPKHCISFFLLK
jgi:hypothetical protein